MSFSPVAAAAGAAAAYLIGSVPWGYIVVRLLKGVDVRGHGSGNIGATNVVRTAGIPAGLAVGFLDVAKGWFGIAAACAVNPGPPPWLEVVLGLAAIAGHNWPLWLRFRGGKGVLTSAGVFLYLAWLPLAGALGVFAAVFLSTGYVSAGSLTAAAAFAGLVVGLPGPWRNPATAAVAFAGFALIVLRHRSNIRDLARGTERRFRVFASRDRRGNGP